MIEEVQVYKNKPRKQKPVRKMRTVGWKRVSRRKTPVRGVSKLIKDLDAIFSRYTRIRASDASGNVSCYTCGHRNHYKKMQAGHYVSRFYKAVRWNEDNVKVQCVMCNMWKNGDAANFREKLVAELGEGGVRYLEESRKVVEKLNPEVLAAKIAYYKAKVDKLLNPPQV